MTSPSLKSLEAKNFKCFETMQVQFGKLTVLCGYNGSGKSTIFQPILLLSQVIGELGSISSNSGKYWPLNGSLIRLGTSADVLYENYRDQKTIEFDFEFNDRRLLCSLNADSEKRHLVCRHPDINMMIGLSHLSQLSYISAIRGSFSDIYPQPDQSESVKTRVGSDGKYASYLYQMMTDEQDNIRNEVNRLLSNVAPSANFEVQQLLDVSHLALKFRLSETSDFRKPANIGFGLSYVFPIIIALLAAKEGDLVIIDSPESHLHPQAQSRVGIMLAEFARKGVQIVVETHSDHILKGIRFAVEISKLLSPDDVSILYTSVFKNNEQKVHKPDILDFESYSQWCEDFMNNPYGELSNYQF